LKGLDKASNFIAEHFQKSEDLPVFIGRLDTIPGDSAKKKKKRKKENREITFARMFFHTKRTKKKSFGTDHQCLRCLWALSRSKNTQKFIGKCFPISET
jgi:hypothetical protein